jgi:hypothetical protein
MMVGLIDHPAAQTSPANIFTRVQISFTDGIRVRDIVVIDHDCGPEHRPGLPASAAILGDHRRAPPRPMARRSPS